MVSTTDNTNPASFTTVGTWTLSLSSAGYTSSPYTVDLSAYSGMGYVAIRHFDCYDQWFLAVDDITIYTGEESQWTTYPASASPFTINDLNPGTSYDVKVIGICDGEESNASTTINFTTAVACPAPIDVNVSDITGHEALVTWTGSSESYIVKYRTAAYMDGIEEGFDSGNLPSGWENKTGLLSTIIDGGAFSTSTQWSFGNNNGVFDYHARINIYGSSRYGWLITPEINVGNDFDLNFDLALTAYSGTGAASGTCDDDRFVVLVYADNAWHILREWNNSGSSYVYNDIPTAGQNVSIGLSSYVGKVVKIAFYGESTTTGNGDNNLHIDNVFVGYPVTAGEWQTVTVEDTFVALTDLVPETLYEVVIQGDCGEEGMSAESEPVTFTTEVSCPAPTGLTVSDINGHGATVSWERVADADHPTVYFQFVCVEHGGTPDWTDAPVAIDRPTNSNPPTGFFFGLAPETEYDAYIRRICGTISPSGVIDGEFSAPAIITFTTTVTCPAPTDVTVNNITGHEATVTWTGSSDSYNVTYREAGGIITIFSEYFENDLSDWTLRDCYAATGISTTSSYIHSGSGSFTFHYSVTPPQYLISPVLTGVTSRTKLEFYYKNASTTWSETFQVGFSSTNDETSSFTFGSTYTASDGEWHLYSETIPAGTKYICWKYTSNDQWYLCIDDIVVGVETTGGEWQTVTTEESTITLTGLASETYYEVVIQGDCGEEGMSAESEPVTFITDVTCPAPHDLTTSDVTSNSAVLHWEGDAESYNVSYYKTFFFDSFEEDLSQWTIYKNGDESSFEWGIENPHDNSADLNAHGGNYAAVAYSDTDVHADNWLITPQITMPTQATLKFWVMRSTYDDAQDEYEVRLSTTGNAVEDFDVVLQEKAAASSTWTEVSIDLSEYDGQPCFIAIHHDFTSGFFIMVDDFGIFGWSEPIATTENSLLIEDLLPETEYLWHVQANCGDEDGLSQWSNIGTFTTLKACPVPFDLNVNEITANGATIAWTGYSESYNVWLGQYEVSTTGYDFEDQTIPSTWTNDANYPWVVTNASSNNGSYSLKSGNYNIGNSSSSIQITVDFEGNGTISFAARCSSEQTSQSNDWDYGTFYIDGIQQGDKFINSTTFDLRSYEVEAGTHTFMWRYKKDGSVNSNDDCFYVDDITIESNVLLSEMNYTATESPFILNDATNILPETTYMVKVKGICGDEETEYSDIINFTTLDENTKIFITEGDWSDDYNWVPAGVPSIEQDVILRAEATVFDVAEANIITIDDAGALTIEDGGQLKTNADVEATMKKFIIGYGTDYVETNDGYYLMTLPIADPISAADAGLITEESEYDLYSWDRTATDEEWQNNHDGIDMQNGAGYLYANQDDMEMSFTATLRNSSESIVVTPAYDEVEHGGWNLYGNPFPCEAYITTDAEGMTFYRLIGSDFVPVTGAIAPMEGFFVKATAAGQTFTISREAPAK
jgi:hypothetical protein